LQLKPLDSPHTRAAAVRRGATVVVIAATIAWIGFYLARRAAVA